MSVQIVTVDGPWDADAPGAALARACAELLDESVAEELGHRDLARGPAWIQASWSPSPYGNSSVLAALEGSRVVGAAHARRSLAENADLLSVDLAVAPGARRRGVGAALAGRLAEHARSVGCARIASYATYRRPPAGGGVRPAAGDGAVPAGHPATRFALSLGAVLQQVERLSLLDLGALAPDTAPAGGAAAVDEGYRLVGWDGAVPEGHVEAYCRLMERMDTDPPAGGMVWEPSVWDRGRLRTAEARRRGRGERLVQTCAVDPTGSLVAFTVLAHGVVPGVAEQEDTLVLPGHRGHGLGLRVKRENLRRLREAAPRVRRIYTWNAEENGPMLDINTALGFRAAHAEALWELSLVTIESNRV